MAHVSRSRRMDYVAYLRDRSLEFRNLAITASDAGACQALHHLADLCAEKAVVLDRGRKSAPTTPGPARG